MRKNARKNWMQNYAAELGLCAAIAAVGIFWRAIDWGIRAAVGPRFTPIVWILVLLLGFAVVTAYFIGQADDAS